MLNLSDVEQRVEKKLLNKIVKHMETELNNCEIKTIDNYDDSSLLIARELNKKLIYSIFLYKLKKGFNCKEYAKNLFFDLVSQKNWDFNSTLGTFEVLTAVSITFNTLKNDFSYEERTAMSDSILKLFLKEFEGYHWWKRKNTNWKQIISSSVLITAISIYEENPKVAKKIINESVSLLNDSMVLYFPDGAYSEGINYYIYGTIYVSLANYFHKKFPDKYLNFEIPVELKKSLNYYSNMIGSSGYTFNYSDSGKFRTLNPSVFYLATSDHSNWLIKKELDLLNDFLSGKITYPKYNEIYLPFYLLWLDRTSKNDYSYQRAHGASIFSGENSVGTIIGKSGQGIDFYLGVKAGSPSINHGHMDVGSFILDIAGVRWFSDLGHPQSYQAAIDKGINLWNRKQNSSRWNLIETGADGHSLLILEDTKQRVSGSVTLDSLDELENGSYGFSMDLSPVFKKSYLPGYLFFDVKREFVVMDYESLQIKDYFSSFFTNENIIWRAITEADVTENDDGSVILTLENKKLKMFISSNCDYSIKIKNINNASGRYKVIEVLFKSAVNLNNVIEFNLL